MGPPCCVILLAFTARSLGRSNGYSGYPLGFQLLGTFVMLFVLSMIPLAMAFPNLSLCEEKNQVNAEKIGKLECRSTADDNELIVSDDIGIVPVDSDKEKKKRA